MKEWKCPTYSNYTRNCKFLTSSETLETPVLWQKFFRNLLIYGVFILSKKQQNLFSKNFHNSGIVFRRRLLDTSLNWGFNALSISIQYPFLLQWPDFGVSFFNYICTNRSVTLIKGNICNISISEIESSCN